jgi:hypothetical protein
VNHHLTDSGIHKESAANAVGITRRRFRGDAAFAIPGLFDLLEEEGWDYAIRMKANPKLHEQVE